MFSAFKSSLALCALAIAGHATAQVTFFEREQFEGQSFTADRPVGNLQRFGFNDRASSAVVGGEPWEVCEDARFEGRCVVLRRGRYASLRAMGLANRISSMRPLEQGAQVDERRYAPQPSAGPQIIFYEHDNFGGQSFSTEREVDDFKRIGFNDRASSAVVIGDRWEACDDARFGGRCVVLRPGRYPELSAFGLNDRISSVRNLSANERIADNRYGPQPPMPVYDSRRGHDELFFEARVTSVRAVMRAAEQRCWVEREQVAVPGRGNEPNVGGAIAGAVIGGILGHQVDDGTGKDLATAGGVIAGAVIGANAGQGDNGQQYRTQNVQRCATAPNQARPEYWEVTYFFRGRQHTVQMTSQPGPTLWVNGLGEPRG
jgi:uncharacterized protein YcfJ